jgi:hypothetical protein
MTRTLLWTGAIVAGVAACLALRSSWPKARMAARRAVATPYRDGTPGTGPATADPGHGQPA